MNHAPTLSLQARMRRSIALLAIGLCGGLAGAATSGTPPVAATASSSAKPLCESQASGYDALLIQCPVGPSAAPQRMRFKVNFSGGHDDTMASMTASLDDAALACDKASKTRLMGEDGEVSLDCGFSTPGKPGAQILRVKVTWSHAQYVGYELNMD